MGTTAIYGLPYPDGTDLVIQGDDAIQALAEAVEDTIYGGTTFAQIAPADSSSATPSTAVLFPGTATMTGFTYTTGGGGALTYDGPPRLFIIYVSVELEASPGTPVSATSIDVKVEGVAIAGSNDDIEVDAGSTIASRQVTHSVSVPTTLDTGDVITVGASTSIAGTVGLTSIRVYPIGPA